MLLNQEGNGLGSETPEQCRKARVDAEIGQWFLADDPKQRLNSEYRRCLEAISIAALKQFKGTATSEMDVSAFEELMEPGISVVTNIRYALQPYDQPEEEAQKMRLWSHRDQPLFEVRAKKIPHFSRSEIEAAAGDYLALSYRSELIDRLLADLLIALELYQYSDEVLNEEVIPGLGPPRSPLKQTHPWVYYAKYRLVTLCFCAVVCGFILVLQRFQIMGDGWALVGYLVCAALFLIDSAVATFALPRAWVRHRKSVAKAKELMLSMLNCYTELRSDGPVSARHLLEQLNVSANKGVSWPGPLYALLDDVLARTGRL